MVDPDTNSLLLLYDVAQSIYKRRNSLGFSLKEVGIENRGPTTVLKLNYRNSQQILSFAYDFVDDYLEESEREEDRTNLPAADSGGQTDPAPVELDFASFTEEAEYIAELFTNMHSKRGIEWRSMSFLYCHNWMGKALADQFTQAGIPSQWMKNSADKREFDIRRGLINIRGPVAP